MTKETVAKNIIRNKSCRKVKCEDCHFFIEGKCMANDPVEASKTYLRSEGVPFKEPKNKTITIWLSEDEHKKLKEESSKMGLTLSAYVRYTTLYRRK